MSKIINFIAKNFKLQAGILIIITAFLYISLVNNLNLWTDEIYSVLMAKDNFHDMWLLLSTEDSKPPLYYLYLKVILNLFPTKWEIWAAHFGSVLLLILAQIFTAIAIRHDFGDKTALWLMALIMLMPQSLWLGLEVRNYMLSALLLMMVAVYGLRLLDSPKNTDFIKLGIYTLCALYTHYYCAIWLMFFYLGVLYFMIASKKFHLYGRLFILTSVGIAICFIPWLYIPLNSGKEISQSWYVSQEFVTYSWRFFINPLGQELIQSSFFIATTFIATTFSFVLLLGFNIQQKKSAKIFKLLFGSFLATYAFLLILSYSIRPMVTERYLRIFSLILYFAAAIVLTQHKIIQKAFLLVAVLGFIFSYIDVHQTSFDKGYQTLTKDIRQFIPNNHPLIAFDQTNLFCEYYLPEYKCLLIIGEKGEFFRLPQVARYAHLYQTVFPETMFSLSLYRYKSDGSCLTYPSLYRNGQDFRLCRYNRDEISPLIKDSLIWLHKRVKTP